jgi:hypothetical protein
MELIDFDLANHTSNPSKTSLRTKRDRPTQARSIAHHRAELVDAKGAKPLAHVLLPEEDGAQRVKLDEESAEQQQ